MLSVSQTDIVPDFEQVVVFSISASEVIQLLLVRFRCCHVLVQKRLLRIAPLLVQPFYLLPVV